MNEIIKPRLVKLNEAFPLFQEGEPRTSNDFVSYLKLTTDIMPPLPIEVVATEETLPRFCRIAPFESDTGYRISREDYDPNTREKKLRKCILETGEDEVLTKSLYTIYIILGGDELEKAGFCREVERYKDEVKYELYPGVSDYLDRLRVVLQFPSGRGEYESKIDDKSPFETSLGMHFYYPSDFGPLSELKPYRGLAGWDYELSQYGLRMFVPPDIQKLSQISGRFLLL